MARSTDRPPPRAARIEAERESQRHRILDAAVARFADKGFEATSVHDVAADAGFSVGHLYNLIGNKEALYDAVVSREGGEMDRLTAAVLHDNRTLAVRTRLDLLTDAVLEFFEKHRAFFRFYLSHTGGLPDDESRLTPTGIRVKRRLERRLLGLMAEGVKDGSLAPLDPHDLKAAYEDHLQGFMARRLVAGSPRAADRATAMRHILWNGIGAAAKRRGGKS